ncbi:hypothetical protein NB705_003564 [Xanthomonas sacchari]|nr:hypothetical protein [Xanthomonas sacchari]
MQRQSILARQQGQVQCLRVDAEAVPRTQPHHVAAGLEQLAAVAQRAHRLVAHALQPRLDVVGLDAVAVAAQPLGQLAQLENQRVAGEEGVEFVGIGEALGAPRQAVEDARGRVQQGARLALAVVEQGLLVRLERLDQFLALAEDVAEELLVLAELALQFLQLHHQPRQLLVGALGIGGQRQRAGDRLAEQRELRAELGHGLGRTQALAALLGTRARLVEPRVDFGQGLDHAGALGGVVDLEPGHQFRQQVQVGRHRLHRLHLLGQPARGRRRLRRRVQLGQARVQRRQRAFAAEETPGGGADRVVGLLQRRAHRIDRIGVDVAVLADGQQMAALRGDGVERFDELLDAVPVLRLQPRQQRLVRGRGLGHRLVGLLADRQHLFVFVQHRLAGGADAAQHAGQVAAVRVLQPMVRVEQAPRVLHQQLVALHRHLVAVDRARQPEQAGDAAHQFGIADAAEEGVARRAPGSEFVAAEGSLPDLHRMDPGRLAALGMEQHHAPVLQQRVAMAEHRVLQRAADGVVDEQRGLAALALVEDVQHVLAVGRANRALELHPVHRRVERLVIAVLQVIAAGKNDAVVLGQLHAGLHDGIVAHDAAAERVVDQPAPLRLAIRQHLEQDQAADPREIELRIIQRLGLVLHRFAVDALSGLGVVLDLDGQIAADGLHEQGIEDVQMRMAPVHRHLAGGAGPFEVERRRQRDVAFAARIDVGERAVAVLRPAEHAHVAAALADLERRQQLAADDDQLQ